MLIVIKDAMKSTTFEKLYGPAKADIIHRRYLELDPVLAEEIHRIAYDHYWARPGLSIRDKSFITVVSLATMGKGEQIRIHLNGFLNAGGSWSEALALIGALSPHVSEVSNQAAVEALRAVAAELHFQFQSDSIGTLSDRDQALIGVAHFVALDNKLRSVASFRKMKSLQLLTEEEVRNVIIHLIVYCGFPTVMNAFAALKEA